jgi:hypothetical protein
VWSCTRGLLGGAGWSGRRRSCWWRRLRRARLKVGTCCATLKAVLSTSVDVTVDVTSDVTADLTAEVTADVTADMTVDVTVDVTSDVTADVTSDVTSDVTADVTVDVTVDVTADVRLDVYAVCLARTPNSVPMLALRAQQRRNRGSAEGGCRAQQRRNRGSAEVDRNAEPTRRGGGGAPPPPRRRRHALWGEVAAALWHLPMQPRWRPGVQHAQLLQHHRCSMASSCKIPEVTRLR